jgi:hypothetical protein
VAVAGVTVAVKVTGVPWNVVVVGVEIEVDVAISDSVQADAKTLASTDPSPVTRL